MTDKKSLSDIEVCVREIRAGRMIIVVDDQNRENEGDLVMAASKVTSRAVNFMVTHGRGLICTPLAPEIARRLRLDSMVAENRETFRTAFTVSVDAREGITTGISANDRARTIRLLAKPDSKESDFVRPGHIFPLMAKPGGVLQRAGHTEAAVDLCRLAGLPPAGVICEILAPDGKMARLPTLLRFAKRHRLKICAVRDLIEYRNKNERLIELSAVREIITAHGPAQFREYRSVVDGKTHFALIFGKPLDDAIVRVRVLRESACEDLFLGQNSPLIQSMAFLSRPPGGVLLYMRTEEMRKELINRPDGNQLLALREYGLGAQILRDLGLKKIALITRHNVRPVGLEAYGLEIVRQDLLSTAAPAEPRIQRLARRKKNTAPQPLRKKNQT